MSSDASIAVGFAVGGALTLLATPVAIAVARRTDFCDRPRGYRRHQGPTPFLGGAAVLVGFLAAAAAVGGITGQLAIVLGCAVGLWVLGTIDDLVAVMPKWRLLAEVGAAVALCAVGLGWDTHFSGPGDIALTVVWVVGLVNAFNLMDNLDGACSTVAGVAAVGIGVIAAIKGQATIAGLAFALAGACAGFLPWNLARPAKIFLGDGGSMPIGFLIAALAIAASRHSQAGNAGILLGALLAGLPILDVTLVSVSRTRRGVSLMTGGRDHLTHRILLALQSPRRVAAALALVQGTLCSVAVLGYQLGTNGVAILALLAFISGVGVILALDTARWRPAGIPVRPQPPSSKSTHATSVRVDAG